MKRTKKPKNQPKTQAPKQPELPDDLAIDSTQPTPTDDGLTPPSDLSQRNKLYWVQTQRALHRLKVERGQVINRAILDVELKQTMADLFSGLDRFFCAELPALGKGLSERELKAIARKKIEELKHFLREKWSTASAVEKTKNANVTK